MENLVEAGSFDFTTWHRNSLLRAIEPIFERTTLIQKEAQVGVLDFFEQKTDEDHDPFEDLKNKGQPAEKKYILMKRKGVVRLFLNRSSYE